MGMGFAEKEETGGRLPLSQFPVSRGGSSFIIVHHSSTTSGLGRSPYAHYGQKVWMTDSPSNSAVPFWPTSILGGCVNVHSMEPTFLCAEPPQVNAVHSQGPR